MTNIIKNLNPKRVFYYFEEISKIPRGTKNEKAISNYIYKLAKEKGLEVIQDEVLNVIIKKEGTRGYENAPVVMLQGHMDMVCEKDNNTIHDFEKDPLKLKILNDCIYAEGTTLGADNGIAIAMMLAILDEVDLEHPPLEMLMTVDEEIGMTGAINIDKNLFNSTILLNLDGDGEGVLTTGCAGGGRIELKIPLKKKDAKYKNAYKIEVKGLQGGHSGAEIHLERANANKLMGIIINNIHNIVEITEIHGGTSDNAIPREARAIVLTDNYEKVYNTIKDLEAEFKNENKKSDPSIEITIEKYKNHEKLSKVFEKETVDKIITTLALIPNGPQVKNIDIDLVIHSNNLGIIDTKEDYVAIVNSPRSSVDSLLKRFRDTLELLAKVLGVEYIEDSFYPGWQYNEESFIKELWVETYKELTEKEPVVKPVHGGLECGLLIEKIGELDAISFGPNIYDTHSPNEHMSISSVERTYKLLLEIIKRIK